VHFFSLHHPFIATKVAAVFMQGVFKLHGMPKLIVSDRGAIFTAAFGGSYLGYKAQNWPCPQLTIHNLRLLIGAWSST